jgi:hypothetical protein
LEDRDELALRFAVEPHRIMGVSEDIGITREYDCVSIRLDDGSCRTLYGSDGYDNPDYIAHRIGQHEAEIARLRALGGTPTG